MLFSPFSELPSGIVGDASFGGERFVRRVAARFGVKYLSSALHIMDRFRVIIELAERRHGNPGTLKNLHPLGAIEFPRGTFGVAPDDQAAAVAPDAELAHREAVALEDGEVSPSDPGAPVRHEFDETLPDRSGFGIEFTDEELDVVPLFLRAQREV